MDAAKPEGLVSRYAFIDNREDAELWLTEENATALSEQGRGAGFKGLAKDHKAGKTYKVYGASCGLPHCMCAWRTKDASPVEASAWKMECVTPTGKEA